MIFEAWICLEKCESRYGSVRAQVRNWKGVRAASERRLALVEALTLSTREKISR